MGNPTAICAGHLVVTVAEEDRYVVCPMIGVIMERKLVLAGSGERMSESFSYIVVFFFVIIK